MVAQEISDAIHYCAYICDLVVVQYSARVSVMPMPMHPEILTDFITGELDITVV